MEKPGLHGQAGRQALDVQGTAGDFPGGNRGVSLEAGEKQFASQKSSSDAFKQSQLSPAPRPGKEERELNKGAQSRLWRGEPRALVGSALASAPASAGLLLTVHISPAAFSPGTVLRCDTVSCVSLSASPSAWSWEPTSARPWD